jgi:hypothetical protein
MALPSGARHDGPGARVGIAEEAASMPDDVIEVVIEIPKAAATSTSSTTNGT